MKTRVQILLSTYNGEKFLEEQLESILNQKGNFSLKILVRDDGSRDGTLEILEKYSKEIEMQIIRGENIGVNNSLRELFMNCDIDCDYFAISDQDDVWLENKLQTAIESLSKNENKLKMFASRSLVTDINMNVVGKTQDPGNRLSYYNAMVQNVCPGHTQVFNKDVILKLRQNYSENIFVIDWWIYLLVSSMGEITFNRSCFVKHRQHGLNSAGYELNFWKKLKKRIYFLNKYKKSPVSEQLNSFFEIYKDQMKEEYRIETEKFFNSQRNIIFRIKYILFSKVFRYGKFENLIFKLLYILGKYK